tara:strand:+ start:463 stop:3096 length:2634 start_codon:yes stop_codon:yes gene_type:complete
MAAIDRKRLEEKIKEIYPGISDKAVRSLMINMHVETGLNDSFLRENAFKHDQLRENKLDKNGKPYLVSANKNLDKWLKGPPLKTKEDYDALTNEQRLGVQYAADENEKFAGGFGLLQLTPGVRTDGKTLGALSPRRAKKRFKVLAKEMGYNNAEELLQAVTTDADVAAEFNLQYYKKYENWDAKELNQYEDPKKMRKKYFNPGEGDVVMDPKIEQSSADYDAKLATYKAAPLTQEDYEKYYEGAESVTIEGNNIVVDFGNGNVITEPKSTVDTNIKQEQQIDSEGGTVGVTETVQKESGQINVTPQPNVLNPEGDEVVSPITEKVESNEGDESGGMSNDIVDENDVEGSEYIVTQEEAERVYGPTAKLTEGNGQERISYTDENGVFKEVDRNIVTKETPNYVVDDQQSEQDTTTEVTEDTTTEVIEETSTEVIDEQTETGQTNITPQPRVIDSEGNEVDSPVTPNTPLQRIEPKSTGPIPIEGGEPDLTRRTVAAEVSTDDSEQTTEQQVEDSDATVNQTVESSSLTQDQIVEIYGPDARTSTNNAGQTQIIVPGVDGAEDEIINMPDAVAKRDNRIALEEEKQQEVNANVIGLRRNDLDGLSEEDLNTRLNQTTIPDEDKENIRSKWTNANKESLLEQIFKKYKKGDGNALKDAASLIKSAGGVSSLVAGFMGAKAAKKGMEEVPVPELNGMTSAFKMYSQQQKALSESGLSYAERRTIEQGIDETYEKGIQNLRVGTGGDRAKFLAGTGALDYNRQTSLLKTAALEDEARRQNRDAYGKLLTFEAQQNRDKDLFTKSREYNQDLADKAMFQNTASSAFKHVFDNIRFGQDYKPLMDQMSILATQISGVSGLVNDIKTDETLSNNIEATDPNETRN